VNGAIIDNVRKALGISDHVYNERPVPLTLFGNYNDLDPVPDLGDEDDMGSGTFSSHGGTVGTRVMSRQQAIERVNLARRRRLKLGVEIPDSGLLVVLIF